MIHVEVEIEGLGPLSWSRPLEEGLKKNEDHKAFEARIWPERFNADEDGICFIPPLAFRHAMEAAAKYSGRKIEGRGKSTYTKHFRSGVLCTEPASLGVHRDELKKEWLFVPSNGVAGHGTRVHRCFPVIGAGWKVRASFVILDETITRDVFEETLDESGKLIGVGRFRPQNGGYYGRFKVNGVSWTED